MTGDQDGVRHCAVRVAGVVQGVGFRPFVHRLASELDLAGHVGNDVDGVFIEVEGSAGQVSAFLDQLVRHPPALAVIDDVDVTDLAPAQPQGFRIVTSPDDSPRGTATSIPPDTATCDDCLVELRDPADRRFGYPFIACTNCGPRFTMVTGLPYDRVNTTMADFPLCPACRDEYQDPRSRRYHAQPTACWQCGPQLSHPVEQVVEALHAGQIVALKGIGGYHLVCNAGDHEVLRRLRDRKQRGDKPFAAMAADLSVVDRIAAPTDRERDLLLSPARPIVLVSGRQGALDSLVAPGNRFVGVMLPYSPVHHLLFDAGAPDVLVMTSGNLSDEPICVDAAQAREHLSGIADMFVDHDRRITVACDDSVTAVVAGRPQPVRRSRGYAPLPVTLPMSSLPAMAVGGELKTTAAVAQGSRVWLTQHIGDTENPATLEMLARTVALVAELQQVTPEVIVSDEHPGYLSRRWAAEQAVNRGMVHLTVQHHHAHLASLLAEHRVPVGELVLGVTFDGTGFAGDGTIWGGELLLGSYDHVDRVGYLRPVALPGGDAAIRHPSRTAMAHLHAAGLPSTGTAPAESLTAGEQRLLEQMLASGSHCTPTSSMGRLFDAIASLLEVRHDVDYEGQAAIELEALATDAHAVPWPAGVDVTAEQIVIDPGGWIARAVSAHRTGVPAAYAARGFHAGVAQAVVAAADEVRRRTGVATVGLTGGVFANRVLTADCMAGLTAAGFAVLVHRVVPPNDGGLALGQIAVAAAGGARRAHERYGE